MADSEKTSEYIVTADASGYEAGMNKAVAASKDAAKQIEGHFSAIGGIFGKLTGAIAGVTAVLAGGAAFRSSMEATRQWGGEVGALSRQLNITTSEAAAMNVALRHLGIEQQTVTGAVDKLTRNMVSNAQAFEVLGIKTKDSNGAWRSGGEILPEVADKLRNITNATQQNIAGQQLFGKSWSEVKGILKLSSDELERARQKVKDLHLEIDPGQVKKYKESMNDLKLITTSLEVQMGNALMPTLTQVGKYLGEEGPTMGKVFARVLQTISAAGMTVWEVLKGVGNTIGGLYAATNAALHGNLSAAKDILTDVMEQNKTAAKRVQEVWKNAYQDIAPPAMGGDHGGGGPALGFKDKDEKAQSRMGVWEEKLALQRDAFEKEQQLAGTMQEFGKQRERDYWKSILETVSMSVEEKTQVNRRYLALERDLRKDAFDSEIAGEKAKMEEYKNNFAERIKLATEIYNQLAARYGADSKEAKAALGDIAKEQRKLAEQTLQINYIVAQAKRDQQLADIEFERQDAEMRVQLRELTVQQLLEKEREFEDRCYQIKLQALHEQEALLANSKENPVALAQLHAQIEQLESQHQLRLQQIRNRSTLEQQKNMTSMYASMQSGLANVLSQTMQGQMKLSDMFRNLFRAVVAAIADMLAKTMAEWAMNLLLGKALSKTSALSEISANAGVAGAAATASAAAIPLIGWMIAPEAGVAASAAAMAFAPMASASGGYDIPAGVNPVTQLHEKEMVLPAKHADVIRSMADGNGSGGGSVVNLNVSAVDGASVKRLFMDHAPALSEAVMNHARNFGVRR